MRKQMQSELQFSMAVLLIQKEDEHKFSQVWWTGWIVWIQING